MSSDPEPIEETLRRAETVLSRLPVAVAQGSASMRYLWVSARYAEWLGLPSDQIVGRPIAEVLGAACLESMRPHVEAALAGQSMQRDAEVHHATLGTRWVHVDCVPTFAASGVPDGWIEAITDVTEQRRIGEHLRENQTALQSFYDSSPWYMGLVELDGDSLIMMYANRTLRREFEVPGYQIDLGHALELFTTPDELRLWVQSYRRAKTEGAPVTFEYEHPMPSGSRWLRATVAFVGEGTRGRPRFSFVAEDVTEHKRVIDALRKANRSKDEFLAMLGHELRNPLSPIVTALHILKLQDDGRSAKTLEVVERQVQYLIRLVDDLLDVSRVTRGNIEIKKRLLRFQDVVAQGIEMAMPLIEQRRHHLEVRLSTADLRLSGDEGRLAQAVANLLTNAAKYTDPGGTIVVEAGQDGNEIVLSVQDTGIGISAELLPHVFDLFTQERQAADRARGGLGIGLTIVHNLVELHGGTVRAESGGHGRGSRFTVRLPATAEEPSAIQRPPAATAALAGAPRQILIVDDNEDALNLLAQLLRAAGHLVRIAKDGPSALVALETFHPVVAVLDIGLPVMDGYELAHRIRERFGDAAPRLIALTGYGQESDRERALRAGFAQHLTKPVEVGSLLGAINPARSRQDARPAL
jgi:signal transduction histidine kinase/ActR/RegA family two-component response regulator